ARHAPIDLRQPLRAVLADRPRAARGATQQELLARLAQLAHAPEILRGVVRRNALQLGRFGSARGARHEDDTEGDEKRTAPVVHRHSALKCFFPVARSMVYGGTQFAGLPAAGT